MSLRSEYGKYGRWMWVPLLSASVGAGIPILIGSWLFGFDFSDDSWEERIWIGMGSTFAVFIWAIFKKIGGRLPKVKEWMLESFWGTTVLFYISGFFISSGGTFFALLPVPHWLTVTAGMILALVALVIMVPPSHEA